MSRIKLLYFVIYILNLYTSNAQISDKRLCVDEECKVPISQAKTLLRYSSPDSRILSFAPNVDITIYSKSAGSREDLWGGEINGKRGYVPKHMVRETKVLKKPTLLVDTEFSNDTEKQVPSQVNSDKVQEPYEIVDGTTIYLSPQGDISPSSIKSPIQTTALPEEVNSAQQEVIKKIVAAETPDDNNSVNTEKLEENPNPTTEETTVEIKESDIINSNEQSSDPENVDISGIPEEEIFDEDDDLEVEGNDEKLDENDEEDSVETEDVSEKVNIETDGNENSENIQDAKVESTTEDSDSIIQEDNNTEAGDIKTETHEVSPSLEIQNEIAGNSEPVVAATNQPSQEENKIEDTNIQNQVSSESEKTVLTNREFEKLDAEQINVSEENNSVSVTETPVEVTTLSAEVEVPQPYDDSLLEVTPNPLGAPEVESASETISSLPPLGLFASSLKDQIQQEAPSEALPEENTFEENTFTEEVLSESKVKEHVSDQQSVTTETTVEEVEPSAADRPDTEESITTENKVEEVDPVATEPSSENFQQHDEKQKDVETPEESENSGFFAGVISMFGSGSSSEEKPEEKELTYEDKVASEEQHPEKDNVFETAGNGEFCDAPSCGEVNDLPVETSGMDFLNFNSDIFIYLVTTAISVIIFLFGYLALDKSKREGPLIAKINKLEKEMLIVVKENQLLQEKLSPDSGYETNDRVSNEVVENLKQDLLHLSSVKTALEEQVQSLEKELENSTEVGLELNRMLSEVLSSESGSDVLKANVEHLQRQLVEQQSTVNSVNETLAVTNTENHELRLELELSNKKVLDLQAELDKLLLNILRIEEEKETQQTTLENEISNLRQKFQELDARFKLKNEEYTAELKQLRSQLDQSERKLELKSNEYNVLTETVKQLKAVKSNETTLQNLLEVGNIKAELQLLKTENQQFSEKLEQEQELKTSYEQRARTADGEIQQLKEKYDEADKLRVETQTKLEVLSNYFKDREAQWQKEISKHEALWAEKEGEATSTTERIQFMHEQLQNYKAQTDSLKQEIMSQEIELKSQISVLEKKAHENWVSARQAERKLEEAKQEAAQLRHRLTLRERAIQEDKTLHRLQSPVEQNGDMPLSPMESPASPPLLYGTRDHITKSPPIPGLPPFLPPPPGVPFMPPPMHGVPPFIPPPPPNMFPGDHRPPPLGRMSSPPLNSRYSPSSRGYSPYDRNSSSPSDSEYGMSPPRRGYSPFNNRSDRRDYKRPPPGRSNGRNLIKGGGSSGSGHSNESLEKINRQHNKV